MKKYHWHLEENNNTQSSINQNNSYTMENRENGRVFISGRNSPINNPDFDNTAGSSTNPQD